MGFSNLRGMLRWGTIPDKMLVPINYVHVSDLQCDNDKALK